MSAVRAPKKRAWRSGYTPAVGKAICKMLASGMTLNQICKRPWMPPQSTVATWALNPQHPFADKYARAREIGYHRMADAITEIADDARNDFMEIEAKNGGMTTVVDHEVVARSRLRVEARKWLLSKALPKIYGDKSETVHKLDATDAFVQMLKLVSDAPKMIEGK